MSDYIVIFGAAVRADGSASGSLRRRCESAANFGLAHFPAHAGASASTAGHGQVDADRNVANREPYYLVTGGVGQHGPAEALVMRDLLVQRGIPVSRILREPKARDTLESVRLCARLLRQQPHVERVWVATSSYHQLRCTGLFRLAGFSCRGVPTPSDRAFLGWAKWLRYVGKECLATPWDMACLLWFRLGRNI